MGSWTLNRPPHMSGVEGTSNTRKAVATLKGWEHPVTGEVLVAIRGLATKAGTGDLLSVQWGVTPTAGGVASVWANFNEKVDVSDGAAIQVKSLLRAYGLLRASTTAAIAAADTVVLGTGSDAKTYTYFASITAGSPANAVKLGTTIADSFTNLKSAVNLAGTAGTDYAASTTVHSTVSLVSLTATKSTGSITCTETAGPPSVTTVAIGSITYTILATTASVTTAGNVYCGALAKNTISNLQGAIVARDGLAPSTSWYIVAAAHPTVTATLSSVTTLLLTSLTAGVENNIIFQSPSQTLPNSSVGGRMTGATNTLKAVSGIGGAVTTTASVTVANKATVWTFTGTGSITQLVGGSLTYITLATTAGTGLTRVTFDRTTGDTSTQHVWATQPQVVSVTTIDLSGTIRDASTTTAVSVTVSSTIVNTLGSFTVARDTI